VNVTLDPNNKNVYVLPPVQSAWMASGATVPHIVKLERFEEQPKHEDLLKIAPFMEAENINSELIK